MNPDAPEFTLPVSSLQRIVHEGSEDLLNHMITEADDFTTESARIELEPQSSFWNRTAGRS